MFWTFVAALAFFFFILVPLVSIVWPILSELLVSRTFWKIVALGMLIVVGGIMTLALFLYGYFSSEEANHTDIQFVENSIQQEELIGSSIADLKKRNPHLKGYYLLLFELPDGSYEFATAGDKKVFDFYYEIGCLNMKQKIIDKYNFPVEKVTCIQF